MKDMLGQELNKNDICIYNGNIIKIIKITKERIYYCAPRSYIEDLDNESEEYVRQNIENYLREASTHLRTNILRISNFDYTSINDFLSNVSKHFINYNKNEKPKIKTLEEIEQEQKNKTEQKRLRALIKPGVVVKTQRYNMMYIGKINSHHAYLKLCYIHYDRSEKLSKNTLETYVDRYISGFFNDPIYYIKSHPKFKDVASIKSNKIVNRVIDALTINHLNGVFTENNQQLRNNINIAIEVLNKEMKE